MKDKIERALTRILIFFITFTLLIMGFICAIVLAGEDSTVVNEVKECVSDFVYTMKNKINVRATKEVLPYNEDLYYYNQLDNNAKIIYTALNENIENMKTGTYRIDLEDIFDELLHQENGEKVLNEAFQNALNAFSMDRMDTFYIDFNKVCLLTESTSRLFLTEYVNYISPENSNYFSKGFNSKEEVDMTLKEIESVKKDVLSIALGSDYEKVKYVHNWLVDKLSYENIDKSSYTIHGALIDKRAVCEGYARAFKYIVDDLDVPCVFIAGDALNSQNISETHAWNYVKIDGKWYAIDVTWDDPILTTGGVASNDIRYKYFCKGAKLFDVNHTANGKLIEEVDFEFKFPELSKDNYELPE